MKNAPTDPAGFLPLPHTELHILLALCDSDKHGYAIMQQVAQETKGQVNLGPGTLYGVIKRLLAAGLIVESKRRPEAKHDDERRRYYRLAPLGRRVVTGELNRLARIVRTGVEFGLIKQNCLAMENSL